MRQPAERLAPREDSTRQNLFRSAGLVGPSCIVNGTQSHRFPETKTVIVPPDEAEPGEQLIYYAFTVLAAYLTSTATAASPSTNMDQLPDPTVFTVESMC